MQTQDTDQAQTREQDNVEQALNRFTEAHSSLTFSLVEGLIMAPGIGRWEPSKTVNGKYIPGHYTPPQAVDDRHIVDYEPEKMAALVTKGSLKLRFLTSYRKACEGYARLHNVLDENRERRYQNVVAALDLLDEHEGEYYCGVCGWVPLSLFPNCHATQETS